MTTAGSGAPRGLVGRLRTLHIRDVAVFGVFMAIFALALRPVLDNDVFWHLATGRYIWATHTIPHVDPFSWTASGRRWIAHEWLTETALYPLYLHGGYTGLTFLFAAIITAAFAVSYATARLLGAARPLAATITILAAVASSHTWGVRPQMLSLLLIALTAWVLTRATFTARRRLLYILPAIMALWVNLHGGFIFGLVLIGLYSLGQTWAALTPYLLASWPLNRWRSSARGVYLRPVWVTEGPGMTVLWAVFGVCVAVCLLNPNGLNGLIYPFSYLGDNASMRYVTEWAPPDFHQWQYWFFGGLVIALVAGVLLATRRPRPTDLLVMALFTYLGLHSVRNINLFAVLVAPLIALYLSSAWRRLRGRAGGTAAPGGCERLPRRVAPATAAINLLFAAVICCGILVVSLPGLSPARNTTAQARHFPVEMVAYLQTHRLPGPLLNSYDWGGYLIWTLYPRVRVYIDGRPDMYGDRFVDAFIRTWWAQPGWQKTLRSQGVRLALVEPASGLGRALAHERGWRLVRRDRVAVLYERI